MISVPWYLMVEEAQIGVYHGDLVLFSRLDHVLIAHGSARTGDISNAGHGRPIHIVAEWEEGVRTERHAVQFLQPFFPLVLYIH